MRLLIGAAIWALVTALLVQLLVEGGRACAARRRESGRHDDGRPAAAHRLGVPAGARPLVTTVRYRCTGCGNLTRFDVVASQRTRRCTTSASGGDLTVEDEIVLDSQVEAVTCVWCGATGDTDRGARRAGGGRLIAPPGRG